MSYTPPSPDHPYGEIISDGNKPDTTGWTQRQLADYNQAIKQSTQDLIGRHQDGKMDGLDKSYVSPGSAEVGGYSGGAKDIHDYFRSGEKENDAAQAANSAAMGQSLDRMRQDRAPIQENATLVGREANSRAQQLQATDLDRQAAMGQAPSAADAQTGMDLNNVMQGQAGAMGSARSLAGLSGTQSAGAGMVGMQATQAGMAGAQGRSQEVNQAMGAYGGIAGDVRGGDLGRLKQSDQNALAGQSLNDDWKLGNAGLAAKQGALGNSQGQVDDQWFGASQEPAARQLGYDQEMNAITEGQSLDSAGAKRAARNAQNDSNRQLAGNAVQGGLTLLGGAVGGPVGAAGGGYLGGLANSKIRG